MSSNSTSQDDPTLPIYGEEPDTCYTIEVIAELAGVDARTVLYYQERGFIRPVVPAATEASVFDAECLRQLRRIEHLRRTYAMNDAGLKMVLDLLHEVECLRQERRRTLR